MLMALEPACQGWNGKTVIVLQFYDDLRKRTFHMREEPLDNLLKDGDEPTRDMDAPPPSMFPLGDVATTTDPLLAEGKGTEEPAAACGDFSL